ncbi:type IV pilus modification protein PilV [uncultured Azonexus sp.]|uniref:type IV pilus modification protein PilV n=1 Tax=uncultured Azonexus sp. TaxID=520307 RepID=UPI00260E5C53|nr:type IV pilus modification protein PilV [uncultured Azonexus sp.]
MRQYQNGMSLVEVMVAVAVLGTGLLGLGALQARALSMAQSAQYRSVAADLAHDLADRIRANRSPFMVVEGGGLHANSLLPPNFANCSQSSDKTSVTCSAQASGRQTYRVQAEMNEWNAALRAQLPEGRFTLLSEPASNVAGTPGAAMFRYSLTITWADNRNSTSPDFSYVAVIE